MRDILPLLLVAGITSLSVWCLTLLDINDWITMFMQVAAGALLTVGIYEMLRQPDYGELKQIILQTFRKARARE